MSEVKTKPHLHASYIDPRAYEIVERLQRRGFTSYLVGGCVRDLILGIQPKDFDIATNATPQEVKRSIANSYIIGRRFKLVLAKRHRDQFEIATFRREATKEELFPVEDLDPTDSSEGDATFIFNDNYFGTPEQDALRRDFTINALFYDPVLHRVIDYAQGEADLKGRVIRMIGNPDRRIVEDPIRSLRAIRLAYKINFTLDGDLRSAILRNSPPVALAALPRRREEYLKILKLPQSSLAFFEMYDLGLIDVCLPSLRELFKSTEGQYFLRAYLDNFQEPHNSYEELLAPSLMAPLVMAMLQFDPNRGWDWIEAFLKNEFGAFKNEIAHLQVALGQLGLFPKIENFRKRSRRRRVGFFENSWFNLQYYANCFEHNISASQQSLWEKEWYLTMLRPQTPEEIEEHEGQSDQDPADDQPHSN